MRRRGHGQAHHPRRHRTGNVNDNYPSIRSDRPPRRIRDDNYRDHLFTPWRNDPDQDHCVDDNYPDRPTERRETRA